MQCDDWHIGKSVGHGVIADAWQGDAADPCHALPRTALPWMRLTVSVNGVSYFHASFRYF